MSKNKDYREDTRLMHLGRNPDDYFGYVNPPVARGSTIIMPDLEAYSDPSRKYRYARMGNPMSEKFEAAVAEIEGGYDAISTGCGVSAITTAMLAFLKAGDHALVTDSIYHPTRVFADNLLKRFGVEIEYYDPTIGADIAELIRDNTTVIFLESPASATFEVQDIPAIAKIAKEKGIITIADNTWSSGIWFRPIEHGVNISLQAATKYIGGHSDINLGVVVADNEANFKRLRQCGWDLGMCAAQDDLYLALRGLRTLKMRKDKAFEQAMIMAKWFKDRPEARRVYYPALEDHPTHDLWKRDFTGAAGIFTVLFDPGPKEAIHAFVNSLKLFPVGSSWGGFESLIQPQYLKTNRKAVPWDEAGYMLRFQIGFEDTQDLIEDLEAGLKVFQEHL